MLELKKFYSVQELSKFNLSEFPTSVRRIKEKAKRENWQSRKRSGKGGGVEYALSSLPKKLDAILDKLDGIADKVDKQNKKIADLQKQVQALQADLSEMAKKNRNQALIAGGIGGGIVAVGIELIRLQFGGYRHYKKAWWQLGQARKTYQKLRSPQCNNSA
ncbi:DNA-binding protein [Pasteurella multocida]